MNRTQILEQVSSLITEIELAHPVRVAIDGIDGAGKAAFGDELAAIVEHQGRPVIRTSADGFHNPRGIRYFRGRTSPEGYFRDSFNYDAMIEHLLEPLGPAKSRQYRTVVFDYRTDLPVISPLLRASVEAVLLFDGVFLLRPELHRFWDLTLFLDVEFEIAMKRCAKSGGRSPDMNAAENRRYVEGQKIYLAECNPKALADLIINNNDLSAPFLQLRS